MNSSSHDDRPWYPAVWDLPGGHVEPTETVQEALVPECHEELGIDVRTLDDPLTVVMGELTLSLCVVRSWRTARPRQGVTDATSPIVWTTPAPHRQEISMKVLVVGATGAVGRPLLRQLLGAGHEVVATARHQPPQMPPGVEFRSLDLLEEAAAAETVRDVAPAAIVHQATALSRMGNNLRAFDRTFATTNRLRVDGTRYLIEAARALDSPPRLIVQSFCGWPWAPTGEAVKSEADAWDPRPAPAFRRTFVALQELEEQVTGYPNGVVLRYAALYGPGTSLGSDGAQIEAIRKRAFPLVGDARATWSFLHVEDAAAAAVAALTRGHGVYNIADDHPVLIGDWLTQIAELTGSPAPRRVPTWLARVVGGEPGAHDDPCSRLLQCQGTPRAGLDPRLCGLAGRLRRGTHPRGSDHVTTRHSFTPSQLLIREARPADLGAVGRLHALSQRTTYRTILPPGATNDIDEERSRATWQARLASPGPRRLLLARSASDGTVGFGLITAEPQTWAALNALHVRPDLHGLGVGSTLLGALLAAALEWSRTRAHLSVLAENHQARGFYLHHGWTLAGQGPAHAIAEHPVDTLRYTRSLTDSEM